MIEQLKTAVSGSFEFKPEIDALHEAFANFNVTVLEPTKGWLYIPTLLPSRTKAFRPLPLERSLNMNQIEDRFLQAIADSDFLYIFNNEQYVGTSTMFELGSAYALHKPLFTKEPWTLENFELELSAYHLFSAISTVATPGEAAQHMRDGTFLRYGSASEMRVHGFDVDSALTEAKY